MNKTATGIIVHGRKLACENSKNQVFLDHIEWDDGQSVTDYMVVAPRAKTGNLITGVSVLPVMDGKYGLIRVYRHPLGDYVWEVPRGFIDEDEEPIAAARRELKEETGLECGRGDMRPLGIIAPEAGTMAARVQLFAALNCIQNVSFRSEEFGHSEIKFFNASEMAAMAADSVIQDPGTLIAYFRLSGITARG